MLNVKTIGAAVVGAAAIGLSVGSVAPAEAATLDFNFSFTNSIFNGGGTVTGIVRDLTDNATSAATSVEVLSNTAGFGIGEYVGNPSENSFTLSGGVIQSADFASLGFLNSPPAVMGSSLQLFFTELEGIAAAGLSNDPNGISVIGALDAELTFTPANPTPIPTPALLLGLLGMGIAAWRKRKNEEPEQVAETAEV